jgi:hypothetical protein
MQIHELTKKPLTEGIFDTFQSPDKIAAQAAEKLRAQGYGQPRPAMSADQAIGSVQKNTAQQQYIKGLVAQWQQQAPKSTPVAPAAVATPTTTAPFAGRSAPLPTVTVDGKLLTKGPDGLWHGEDGRAVTDTAQVAKIDKAYYTGMRNQKGTVKEAFRTPQQTAAARAQRRRPSAGSVAADPYKSAFEDWAAKKLLTKEPVTRETITLDAIKNTAIGSQLDQALAQVVATVSDPQKNAVAVNNYLTTAVAGVVMKTQELRDKQNTGTTGGGARVGQGIVTQQDLRNRLQQQVGLNPTQLDALKKLGSDPAARQAMLKLFGS